MLHKIPRCLQMYVLQLSRSRVAVESIDKLYDVTFNSYHDKTKTVKECGGNSITEMRHNCTNMTNRSDQKRYLTQCARFGCTNTTPHHQNQQPSKESSLPTLLLLTTEPSRFVERSESFLKTSPLYENTTFRPSNNTVTDPLETLPRLEYDEVQTFLHCATTDFSPKTYVEYFRTFVCNVTSSGKASDFFSLGERHIQKFGKRDLQELLKEIIVLEPKLSHMHSFLKAVDLECSRRASMWDTSSCLLCLDLWYTIDGNKLVKRKYWNILLRGWESKSIVWSLQNMVQLLFYIGIAKSAPHALLFKLEAQLDGQIAMASSDELGIICDGFFKNRYRLGSTTILAAVDVTAKSLMDLEWIDSFNLIRLLKVLRHSQKVSDDLCCRLITVLNTGLLDRCNLTECGHYFATLANAKKYDANLVNAIETLFLQLLTKENKYLSNIRRPNFRTHPSLKSRPKDISRMIWSFSEVSHEVQSQNFDKIVVQHLELCCQHGYFDREPHILLDSLLSLSILNFHPIKLIKYVFSSEHWERILRLRNDKALKQLYTLSQIVALECSSSKYNNLTPHADFYITPNLKELDEEVQRRPALQVAAALLKPLVNDDKLQPIRVLPYINLAGFMLSLDFNGKVLTNISASSGVPVFGNKTLCWLNDNVIENLVGRSKSKYLGVTSVNGSYEVPKQQLYMAVEILDSTTSVKDTGKPVGLMSLKFRHLNCLKCKVLIITQNQLQQILNEDNEARIKILKNLMQQLI